MSRPTIITEVDQVDYWSRICPYRNCSISWWFFFCN